MAPEEKIDAALRELPPLDRVTALIISVLEDEACAPAAALTLISVGARMSRHFSPSQRLAIAWRLLEEAERIGAQWN
jgi:hypothetical protein